MTPWLDDGDVKLYHGDALEQLRLMPSESVQCAVTSPPFYSLRDYGVDGQIGLEATLSEWVASLVAVFTELKRVLRDDGTFWLEIGDSYADKQLAGAPWRLAFALQEAGWFLRSDCIWARLCPNPMPESVTDRPTKAHSYVFLLSKSARYFYDADAIREDAMPASEARYAYGFGGPKNEALAEADKNGIGVRTRPIGERTPNPAGRNARSVWSIATEPTPFAHFATFPQALVERCIKASTSEHGCCSECGAPWRRITEMTPEYLAWKQRESGWTDHNTPEVRGSVGSGTNSQTVPQKHTTRGWEPACDHFTTAGLSACLDVSGLSRFSRVAPDGAETGASITPCVVLDPFMGSGTTALVARRLGRHAWGVELNLEYLAISARRLQQPTLWSQPQ